jgi:hypothetical protein
MAGRKSPYWFQNRPAHSVPLEARCAEAAKALSRNFGLLSAADYGRLSELVFLLAASRLPDVRTNEFWPHFHREFEKLSETRYTRSEVTQFFRSVLRGAYPDLLDDIRSNGVHACYIALIFEQSGIGADRKRLIREFLAGLLGLIRRGGDLDAIRPVELAAAFSKGNPHEREIDPLIPVLNEISAAVMGFCRFLRDRPDRLELVELGWDKLASVWRRSSGVDPNALTPSAQELLYEVVRGLARVVTRDDAFQSVSVGRLRLLVPGSQDAIRGAKSAADYPIGPARVLDALGERNIVLVDDPKLPPEALTDLIGKGWQEADDGLVFRVEQEPFSETTPGGARVAAVPLWIGQAPEVALLAGRYWGMYFSEESLVQRPRATELLWLKFALRVYDERLRLYVNWFSASTSIDCDEASLNLGSRIIWKGQVVAGRPVGFTSIGLDIEPDDLNGLKISIRLAIPDVADLCRLVRVPFLDDAAFLVCDGQIVPPVSDFPVLAKKNGSVEAVVLYCTDDTPVTAVGASLQEQGLSEIVGWRFRKFCLRFDGENQSAIRVHAGLMEWNLVVQRAIYFRADCNERVRFGDIAVIGSPSILPVAMGILPDLVLERGSAPLGDAVPSNLTLHLKAGKEVLVPLETEHVRQLDGVWKIALGDVIGGRLLELSAGPVEVGLGVWARKPDQWITLFILPDAPEVVPCRMGVPSQLRPVRSAEWSPLVSDWVVDRASIMSQRIATGSMAFSNGALIFQWLPKLEDLLIGDNRNCVQDTRTISLCTFSDGEICAQAHGPPGSEWQVDIGDQQIRIPSGDSKDIRAAILAILRSNGAQNIEVVARLYDTDRAPAVWTLDAAPQVSDFSAQWSEPSSEGLAILTVRCGVTSLAATGLAIEFLVGGRIAVTQLFNIGQPAGEKQQVSASASVLLNPVHGDAISTVVLRYLVRDRLLFSSEVHAPIVHLTAPQNSDASRAAAVRLLHTFAKQPSDAIGEALLLHLLLHASLRHELAIPRARLQSVLQSQNGNSAAAFIAYSVALLESILVRRPIPVIGADRLVCSPFLQVLGHSLKIFHCHTMAEKGLLVPDQLLWAMGAMQRGILADGVERWRKWCEAVLLFGQRVILGGIGPPIPLSSEQDIRKAVLTEPLARVYPPFAAWLTDD